MNVVLGLFYFTKGYLDFLLAEWVYFLVNKRVIDPKARPCWGNVFRPNDVLVINA